VSDIGVGAHISRVFATELEAKAEKLPHRRALHGPAATDRAGEIDLVHAPRADDLRGLLMIEHDVLEQPGRQFCAAKRLSETFADQQRLRGVLEDDAIAGHECRDDRVDRGQVGIIPRCDDQHGTQRLAFYLSLEAGFWAGIDRRQRFRRDGDHVARTLFETAQFSGAIAHRAAHLPGQLGHDFVAHGDHRIYRRRTKSSSLGQRPAFPFQLRLVRGSQRSLDVRWLGSLPLCVDQSVNGGNQLDRSAHVVLSTVQSRAGVPNR